MTSERVGRYELRNRLGAGGAGVVYRAWDPAARREVALKLLHAREGGPVAQQRFLTECQALARLDHPHIVRVLDVGEAQGRPFLALELVEGRSLQERLNHEGPLPVEDVTEIARALARALEHAHQQGIVHRDLKPANVLEGAGRILLTDFGLARDLESGSHRLTVTGQFTGTPGFWSPEQARGELDAIGPRSDIYGLGATLYALLTGEPPHAGESLVDAIQATQRAIDPPSRRRPGVPRALERLVMRCLERDPEKRYPSSHELTLDLDGSAAARPVPRAVLVGAVLAPLTVLGVGVAALRPPEAAPPAAPEVARASPAPPRVTPPAPAPPSRVDRVTARARAALALRDWAGALAALAGQGEPEAWYLRGQIAFDRSEYEHPERALEQALGAFGQVAEGHPLRAPAQAYSALCLKALGRPWEATARSALAAPEQDERAHPVLLHVRLHVLNAEHAGPDRRALDARLIREYSAGTARAPTDVVSWCGTARAHARRGEFREALAVLARGLEVLPTHPELHHTRGYLTRDWARREDSGARMRQAIEHLTQALSLEPRHGPAAAARGQCRLELAQRSQPPAPDLLEQGLADLRQAAARLPERRGIRWLQVQALEALGRPSEALPVLDGLVTEDPEEVSYLLRRALLRAKSGQAARALADLRAGQKLLHPGDRRGPQVTQMIQALEVQLGEKK